MFSMQNLLSSNRTAIFNFYWPSFLEQTIAIKVKFCGIKYSKYSLICIYIDTLNFAYKDNLLRVYLLKFYPAIQTFLLTTVFLLFILFKYYQITLFIKRYIRTRKEKAKGRGVGYFCF
jgi:hypothetical protein